MTALKAIAAGISVAIVVGAQAPSPTAACDTIASRVRAAADVRDGVRTVWSFATSGADPLIEVADTAEISLGPNPLPDERVEFEKRIRARYGNAAAVLKELLAWDNFDILALRGSQVRMLLSVNGEDRCESRYFLRVTTSRDVVRVPDPPAKTSGEPGNAICQHSGGWGYFARVGGAEAFVEYHAAVQEESLRLVPLIDAAWQPGCSVSAKFRPSSPTDKRERLDSVTVVASK